jgi:hypothetical protein
MIMKLADCIELLEQLKLPSLEQAWDKVLTDWIARKRSTMEINGAKVRFFIYSIWPIS